MLDEKNETGSVESNEGDEACTVNKYSSRNAQATGLESEMQSSANQISSSALSNDSSTSKIDMDKDSAKNEQSQPSVTTSTDAKPSALPQTLDFEPPDLEPAYETLRTLRANQSGCSTLYLRRREYSDERFFDIDLKRIRLLEKEGVVKTSVYNRQGTPDPSVLQVDLLPNALEVLESRATIPPQPVTGALQETEEEPAWKANKRRQQFARTERGSAIANSSPEALISDIQGNIAMMKSGTVKEAEWKGRQIWLKYELMHRWADIPEKLRNEAQYWRDLPYPRRRKK